MTRENDHRPDIRTAWLLGTDTTRLEELLHRLGVHNPITAAQQVTALLSDPLTAWARREQELLWDDLDEATRVAYNGAWSVGAANLAARIVAAARLAGPISYRAVPWRLVAGGVYEAVLTAGNLTAELPTEQEWQLLDAELRELGTRATERPRYAATIAAINADRAWINEGID